MNKSEVELAKEFQRFIVLIVTYFDINRNSIIGQAIQRANVLIKNSLGENK